MRCSVLVLVCAVLVLVCAPQRTCMLHSFVGATDDCLRELEKCDYILTASPHATAAKVDKTFPGTDLRHFVI